MWGERLTPECRESVQTSFVSTCKLDSLFKAEQIYTQAGTFLVAEQGLRKKHIKIWINKTWSQIEIVMVYHRRKTQHSDRANIYVVVDCLLFYFNYAVEYVIVYRQLIPLALVVWLINNRSLFSVTRDQKWKASWNVFGKEPVSLYVSPRPSY